MTWFRAAHAQSEDWMVAAKGCIASLGELSADANIGFIYVTDHLAGDLQSLVTYLGQRTGIINWVGTVGLGICADGKEMFDCSALALMVGGLPEDSFRILPAIDGDVAQISGETRGWMARNQPGFGVVHANPSCGDLPGLIHGLSASAAFFLVGGVAASRNSSPHVAGRVAENGISGILFASSVTVSTGLSQGCTPLGPAHVVTEGNENVLISLDGEPALDVFKTDIGELLARDLSRLGGYVHAALPIPGSDTGDYTVRNLVAIDPDRGWLAIGDTVNPGDRVMFVRRDPASAEEDLIAMLKRTAARLDEPPKGALYFSCVGRGENMFGKPGRELELVREILGEVPLVGFFGNGEISRDRIYGYTGVLTLFV
jgi:small ligand-binding sensory domain FIST